jgi:hypothetical protein
MDVAATGSEDGPPHARLHESAGRGLVAAQFLTAGRRSDWVR